MRNPNGYGSVIKLAGKRRRPYMVRITTGWEDGKQKYGVLGYFAKRSEAIKCLTDYNETPYDIDLAKITFSEVYERWSAEAFPKMKPNVAALHKSAYNQHCKPLYDVQYRLLRKHDFQDLIDNCPRGYSVKCCIRNLVKHMDAWAFDRDIISKMYSTNLEVVEEEKAKEGQPFTPKEIQKLWELQGQPFVDDALVQIYTGFRVSEILMLMPENIDLKEKTIKAGVKTAAGKNRIVPIHPDILPIIKAHLVEGMPLFPNRYKRQENYLVDRQKAMDAYGFDHTSHDCRHTFRSALDSAGANKVCIDRLMGHASRGTGEKVYTHKTLEELRQTILLLPFTSNAQYTNEQKEKPQNP